MNSLVLFGYTLVIWFLGALYGAFVFEYRNDNRTLREIAGELR